MAQDAGDQSEELKRLLRRIEQADQPGRSLGPERSNSVAVPEPNGQPVNTGLRTSRPTMPPDAMRPLRGEVAALKVSTTSGKLGLAGKMAIATASAAVFATILVLAVPPISIVVIRGSANDPKSQGPDLAAGAVADPDPMRPQPSTAFNGTDPEREKPRPLPSVADQKVSGRPDLAEPAAVQQPAPARLQPDEVARLLKRGEDLLGSGDIVAARAVFKLLAASGEQQGAFMIAETYEQSTLARLGVKGLDPDSAMARIWYQRARELGSTEAQRRLDVLASKQR
jgi:hypothetical protein